MTFTEILNSIQSLTLNWIPNLNLIVVLAMVTMNSREENDVYCVKIIEMIIVRAF